jgi:polar amino acid transport system substrate-binding protein
VPVDEAAAACADGVPTVADGVLTVATGEPAFPPYIIDDTPESGQGFEAAVAYAVAGTMGFAPDAVRWVRTPFDAAIQPGPKEFDFNLQQYTITEERSQVVSFSQPYYAGNQAILGYADSPAAGAESITDFQALRIGVAAGTTSLTFVTDVLQPESDPLVYNDNAGAKAALDAQQIDAIVADLPTALYITAVEIEGTEVFGQFPASAGTEGDPWGLLFAKDNPLVECANLALTALESSGTLDAITTEWMSEGAGVPEFDLE